VKRDENRNSQFKTDREPGKGGSTRLMEPWKKKKCHIRKDVNVTKRLGESQGKKSQEDAGEAQGEEKRHEEEVFCRMVGILISEGTCKEERKSKRGEGGKKNVQPNKR